MRSSFAAPMAVTVLLASGCGMRSLSLRERVEQSEWLQVNVKYVEMWTGRLSEYADQLFELQPEKPKFLPVDRLFYTVLNTTLFPSQAEAKEAWAVVLLAGTSQGRHEQLSAFLDYMREDPLLERIGLWMRQQEGTRQDRAERHRAKAKAYFAAQPRSEVERAEFIKHMIGFMELVEEQGILAGRGDELQRLAADLRAHAEDVGRAEARDAGRWRAEQARWDAFSDWLRQERERNRDERLLDALRRPRTCFQAGQTITCY